jgi:hypothetical protein
LLPGDPSKVSRLTKPINPHGEESMSSTTLVRLSGLALIVAFALSLAGGVLHPIVDGDSHSAQTIAHSRFPIAHLLIFLGGAFLLIGLPGLYARIAPTVGKLGLAGFILYFLASATLVMFFAGYEAFVAPVLAGDPATSGLVGADGAIPSSNGFGILEGIGGPAYMLGMLLLGIAVVRSRVMPRWTGVLLAVAPILLLLPLPERPVLTGLLIEVPRGLAVAAMGYVLFASGHRQPVTLANTDTAQLEGQAA